jgi:uncharacterized protein YeaO (DUF488 family)
MTAGDMIPPWNVRLKRAYEPAAPADGVRILIDRRWPRGLSKSEAALDLWEQDVAPTSKLRIWFGLDPVRWADFSDRYWTELENHPEPLSRLRTLARRQTVTLVYAARDRAHSHARVRLRN